MGQTKNMMIEEDWERVCETDNIYLIQKQMEEEQQLAEEIKESRNIKLVVTDPTAKNLLGLFGADKEKMEWISDFVNNIIHTEKKINGRELALRIIDRFVLTPEEWCCVFYTLSNVATKAELINNPLKLFM